MSANQPRPRVDVPDLRLDVDQPPKANEVLPQVRVYPSVCGKEIWLGFNIRATCDRLAPCPIHGGRR